MKPLLLAFTCLVIATSMPSVLHAQAAGAGSLERMLTGNRWDVETERGLRAWGDIRFRDGHEFSTMNGPQGAWKVTGERTLELGGTYVVEFAPGLESFVITMKNGGAKIAMGKRMGTTASVPPLEKPVMPAASPSTPQKPTAQPPTLSEADKLLERHLIGTTWTFPWDIGNPAVRFEENGRLVLQWSTRAPRKWRVRGDGVIEVFPFSVPTKMDTIRISSTEHTGVLTRDGKKYKIERKK